MNISSIKSKPLPKDYQEIILAIKAQIANSEKLHIDFEHRHNNGVQDKAVIYCLQHAVDVAKGCLITAIAELPDSLATLSRALLETMFWVRYVTIAEEYAQEFVDSMKNELIRLGRKNIIAGNARIFEISTHKDVTSEVLDSQLMKDVPKRMTIESAAKIGGLESIYSRIYGFKSMISHGRSYSLKTNADENKILYASLCTALCALECIEVIASDWIISRKNTSRQTLFQLLGI